MRPKSVSEATEALETAETFMEILSKLFGSGSRVKIMRLFLFSPDRFYTSHEVARQTKINGAVASRELRLLLRAGMIKRKLPSLYKSQKLSAGRRKNGRRVRLARREAHFVLSARFPFLIPLQNLLINSILLKDENLVRRLGKTGSVKLILIAGVFIHNLDSMVDLLVVGDRMKRVPLESAIRSIESEIGKELRYAVFETSEFQYRTSICDKLIRDVLEFPHRVILDKLGLRSYSPHIALYQRPF